jgi:hypothetical protein
VVNVNTPLVSVSATNTEVAINNLSYAIQQIRADIMTGASLHEYTDVAGIANVNKGDFENTQLRFYQDTSDSNKKWLVTMLSETLFKSEFTAV